PVPDPEAVPPLPPKAVAEVALTLWAPVMLSVAVAAPPAPPLLVFEAPTAAPPPAPLATLEALTFVDLLEFAVSSKVRLELAAPPLPGVLPLLVPPAPPFAV